MTKRMRVGHVYPPSKNPFEYYQVEKDADGWVDASLYLPLTYDLVHLKIKDKKRIVSGWWTGWTWDGTQVTSKDEVLYWKRNLEDYGDMKWERR